MADKKQVNVTERDLNIKPEMTSEEREAQQDLDEKAQKDLENGPVRDFDHTYWHPGMVTRFPYLGFGALAVVLLCAMGSVLTLSLADGKSQSKWPSAVAPNVLISVMNSVANIGFAIAISNGVAIAWWRKTLQGSTIEQLNRSYKFSTSSIKDVILGVKYFNLIALAALTAKLTIIDSTLLQKAFSTEVRPDAAVFYNLTGYANTSIPNTGRVSGRMAQAGLLAKNFNDDLKIWVQGGGVLPQTYVGCEGLCYLRVPGAGFEFDCDAPSSTAIDNGNQTVQALISLTQNPLCTETNTTEICKSIFANFTAPLFNVDFQAVYDSTGNGSYITMNLLWTNASDEGDSSCPGMRYQQTCTLRPAVINYPVEIQQYKDSHAAASMSLGVDPYVYDNSTFPNFNETQQNYFDVLSHSNIYEDRTTTADSRTRLGGVAQGLNMYLGGNASMYAGNPAGFYLSQQGNAPTYLTNDLGVQTGGSDSSQLCGFKYVNPLKRQTFSNNAAANQDNYIVPSVVGKINEIMFALALDISNEDDDKDSAAGSLSRPATVYKDTIHYVTNKAYMWGAFASIIVCVLCVLPVYWGYWQLGRAVTLGPFEIAAAFRAPNLHHPSNAPIDSLIQEVGDRRVKYGHIISGADAGRIGIAEPESVARIHPSAKNLNWRLSGLGS